MSPGSASSPSLHHHQHHHSQHSEATLCSLRGSDARPSSHPLRQNPPSIAESDSHFDDVDISDHIRPPPSAFTNSTAYDPHAEQPSPLDDYPLGPRHDRGHQRSLTNTFFDNCQPFLSRATSTLQQHTSRASLPSPTKSLASFIPSRGSVLASTASQPKIKAGAQALQNWFNGSSGPVHVGLGPADSDDDYYDSEADEEPTMIGGIFNRSPTLTRPASDTTPKQTTPTPARSQPPTSSSKFAWLLSTQKNAAVPTASRTPTYHDPSDELLNLNIPQALFPHGPVDPLAPESFNDLLSTAEHLLTQYQSAYRQLSSAFGDARAEQSAQEDELDESETRVRHLKMQLETMAARASEQDIQMRRMMDELAYERRLRQEEEAARKRSLALVKEQASYQTTQDPTSSPRRKNRISNSEVSVDSGFESECESEAASIFSRTNCMSPTETIASSAASVAEYDVHTTPTPKLKQPQPLQRRSTYDKVRDGSVDLVNGGWGCANCEGGSQASVWGRLASEREESRMLRRRVEVLEDTIEGALNVVDGPWGM